jgi:hypothetical protein
MAKLRNVTDAEIIACHVGADSFLMELQDFLHRINAGAVDHIEHPAESARSFALIAREASSMAAVLLMQARLQEQRAEIAKLRSQVV